MKFYLSVLLLVFISCSKKDNISPEYNISQVSGNYKGGTLYWQKTTGGTTTNGTDANFTFSVLYLGNDSVKLTINTTAPITTKVYVIPLSGTQEVTQSKLYAFSTTIPYMGITLVVQLAVTIYADSSSPTNGSFTFGYRNNGPEYFEGIGNQY